MKKPYQIEAWRAVKGLEEMAADGNPAVQMVLPMAEIVGWLHKGVGELVRQAGLQLMQLLMEEEVRHLVGERGQSLPERTANRWGSERGYCVVMGQKVPVERPRVRSTQDREIRLGSYEMFHRGEPLTETVWEKLMLGLTTRKYGDAVRQFTNLPFSEWTQVIPNARLCKAVLDRITDRAHILETGTESYRFRRTIDKRTKGERTQDKK